MLAARIGWASDARAGIPQAEAAYRVVTTKYPKSELPLCLPLGVCAAERVMPRRRRRAEVVVERFELRGD